MKILIATVILSIFLACSNPFDASIAVRYEVTGSTEYVNITYENDSGGISQVTNVPVPWSLSFSGDIEDYVYLSAQNQGETGSVTVTIFRDENVFKKATSKGSYVIASVSGTL